MKDMLKQIKWHRSEKKKPKDNIFCLVIDYMGNLRVGYYKNSTFHFMQTELIDILSSDVNHEITIEESQNDTDFDWFYKWAYIPKSFTDKEIKKNDFNRFEHMNLD